MPLTRIRETLRRLPIRVAEVRPSRLTVLYVAALTLPLVLLFAGAKVQKAVRLGETAALPQDPLTPLGLALVDVAVFGPWLALWAWALHAGGPGTRRNVAIALHAATLGLLVLGVLEHGFFLSTGSLLDWSLLAYGTEHVGMLRRVILHEVHAGIVVAFVAVVLLSVLPLAIGPLRRWWHPDTPQTGRALPWLLLPLALPLVLLAPASAPPRLQPLQVSPVLHLARGAFDALTGSDESTPSALVHAPIQPIVVTTGARTRRLNVVLIVLESTRAQSTTPYAHETPQLAGLPEAATALQAYLPTTPFLDKLARAGVRAQAAYTTVPHTTKSLVPIHCGLPPRISAAFEEASPGALPSDCLARILKRHGWSTGYFTPCEAVFERNRELVEQFGFDTMVAREDLDPKGFAETNYFGLEDKAILQPALAWVDKQPGPFFLAVLTLTSHHGYGLPPTFQKHRYVADDKLSDYLNTLRYTDEFVAELHDGLRQRGKLDDTLFVVVGDHGEAFGEHGIYQHDAIGYEEGLRVPFIVSGAGVGKPRVAGGLWQNIDVLPTVLDALGLEVVAGELPGRSVLSQTGHERLFFSCWHKNQCLAMREGTQKTLFHYDKRPTEVFDLATDPLEKTDLAASGKVPATEVARRVAQMQAWKAAVNARYDAQALRRRTPFVSTDRPEVKFAADLTFGGFARLIGYDIEPRNLKAGEPMWITLHFEVLRDPGKGWELFLHAMGPDAHFTRADHVPVEGSHPVPNWKPGQYVTDRTWLRIDPGAPSGAYELVFGFFNTADKDHRAGIEGPVSTGLLKPSKLTEDMGLPIDLESRAHLATVTLDNPKRPPHPLLVGRDALAEDKRVFVRKGPVTGQRTVDVTFGKAIRLFHVEPPAPVEPGQEWVLRTWYEPLLPTPRFTELFLHVRGMGKYHNGSHVPVRGAYPVDRWLKGELVEDDYRFTVPVDWPPGEYEAWMGFWSPNADTEMQRLAPVGKGLLIDKEFRVKFPSLKVVAKGTLPVPKNVLLPEAVTP